MAIDDGGGGGTVRKKRRRRNSRRRSLELHRLRGRRCRRLRMLSFVHRGWWIVRAS